MLRAWVYDFLTSSRVEEIKDKKEFDKIFSSGEPTIIDFYSPWAFSSRRFDPELVRLSRLLPTIQFRRLSCEKLSQLCDDLQVHFYPSLRFYTGKKSSNRKGVNVDLPNLEDVDQLDLTNLSQNILELLSRDISSSNSIKTEL